MGLLANRTTCRRTSTTAGFSAISLPPVIIPLGSSSFSGAKRISSAQLRAEWNTTTLLSND